uniref:Uncharacterized protein n=1 Tax=Avena sativa TaxID=4498 RepID=A0ACD5X1D5_AVESA
MPSRRKKILQSKRSVERQEGFRLRGSPRRFLEDASAKGDLETFSGSLFHADSSSDVDPPAGLPDEPIKSSPEPRYHQIISSRLAELQLPVRDDSSDLVGSSNLPSREVLEALTRKSFHDDDLRAALVQYQIQNFLNETKGRDRDYGESDSAVVDMGSTYTEPDDVITLEENMKHCEVLAAHKAEIDTYTKLDQEQANKLYLKHALYRIRAALLLKGKPVEELDVAALERKYPPDLIVKNNYLFHYEEDSFFGWYFDSDLCYKECLTDYQRLVLFNGDGGNEYPSGSRYREFYSTPEADKAYLRYWETIVKEIKWLEQYVLTKESSIEWVNMLSKAMLQANRIAAGIPDMTLHLAVLGFHEYIWITRSYLMFVKDLDGIFYEIWKRVNNDHQLCFRDALKQVYDEKLFPAQDLSMKYELKYGGSKMERAFGRCTKGISDSVPEYKARELIAQEIRFTKGSSGTYERYARKKLKIAELIGLIQKDKIAAA